MYEYNNLGLLAKEEEKEKDSKSIKKAYTYTPDGRVETISVTSEVSETVNKKTIVRKVTETISYTYDAKGNITEEKTVTEANEHAIAELLSGADGTAGGLYETTVKVRKYDRAGRLEAEGVIREQSGESDGTQEVEKQISDYLDHWRLDTGYMLSFNFNKKMM